MKKIITIYLLVLGTSFAQGQDIFTVAGTNTGAYSGDGGLGIAADLNGPTNVATDANGNIYIADTKNSVIRMLNTHDSIITIAGNGAAGYSGDGSLATKAELNNPTGVTVDKFGNIYIADYDNNCIRKVNASGIMSTFAGGNPGYSGDGGQATAAGMSLPSQVATDNAGNVYIGEYYASVIRKVDISTGIITTIAGTGVAGYSGDGGQATAAVLSGANGMTVDAAGNVYIADDNNYRIRMINTLGVITTVVGNGIQGKGGDGGQGTAAQLTLPNHIAFDVAGNMYIADPGANNIRMINPSGVITTIAGNGTAGFGGDGGAATAGELNYPNCVTVDGSGNVFVADRYNNRIREIGKSPLSINELVKTGDVRVYPVPNNGNFTIALSNNNYGVSDLEIYNILGEKVYSQSINSKQNNITLSLNLNTGLYILQLKSGNGIISKKIEVVNK
jgi:sugar lactone lactonase YvrE